MVLATVGFLVMAGWGQDSLHHVSSSAVLAMAGFGFGLALAPVNAALLASTADSVHGVTSALLVVARMVGMLVGISALTTIGLRRYYAVQADIPSPNSVCGASTTRCAAYTRLVEQAGIEQLQAIFLGAAICAVLAGCGRRRTLPRRSHPRHHPPTGRCAEPGSLLPVANEFDDLIAANKEFADSFDLSGFDGVAHAGVAIVTCMDSRIAPLADGRALPR